MKIDYVYAFSAQFQTFGLKLMPILSNNNHNNVNVVQANWINIGTHQIILTLIIIKYQLLVKIIAAIVLI